MEELLMQTLVNVTVLVDLLGMTVRFVMLCVRMMEFLTAVHAPVLVLMGSLEQTVQIHARTPMNGATQVQAGLHIPVMMMTSSTGFFPTVLKCVACVFHFVVRAITEAFLMKPPVTVTALEDSLVMIVQSVMLLVQMEEC